MIDEIDKRVLEELKKNSRATVRQISKSLNLPITTVHNRLRKLQHDKIIKQFTVIPDYDKLDQSVSAFVMVSADHARMGSGKTSLDSFKKELKKIPEIEKMYALTGNVDWVLMVRVKDIKALDYLLINKLRNIKGISTTTTQVILEED